MQAFWSYILASKPYGTLYIGVTNGLIRRVEHHRAGTASGFTRKCKVHCLVWYEEFADVRDAIQREKSLKEWPRQWKINLIERTNPHWVDLFPSLPGVGATVSSPAEKWVPGTRPGMTRETRRKQKCAPQS